MSGGEPDPDMDAFGNPITSDELLRMVQHLFDRMVSNGGQSLPFLGRDGVMRYARAGRLKFVLSRWDGERIEMPGTTPIPATVSRPITREYITPATARHPDPQTVAVPGTLTFKFASAHIDASDEVLYIYYDEVL